MMADDLDVESWLEAPYKPEVAMETRETPRENNRPAATEEKRPSSRSRDKDSHKDSSRHRSDSRERRHRSSRHRSTSRDRGEERRSSRSSRRSTSRSRSERHRRDRRDGSRERHRDGSKDRRRDSSRERRRESSRDKRRGESSRERRRESSREKRRTRSPPRRPRKERSPSPIISEADRDQRTVFVIQLAARLTTSELRDFFSKVGRVRDARIVSDRNSRRSKGVGYVEFYDVKSVEPALALTGQKLLGIPVIVQNTEAEKNRIAEANAAAMRSLASPGGLSHRLYIGNLQYNLTEEDLKLLFEPFGQIELIEIPKDLATGRGRGYAFIQYRNGDDSRQALSQMNGFELGGRPIRVGSVSDRTSISASLDDPDSGMVLNSQSRADLMKKLARKEDLEIMPQNVGVVSSIITPTLSRSVVLENMFDPEEETEPDWEQFLEGEVKSECGKFGKVVHIFLDPKSKGTIFVRFDNIPAANQAIQSLHGRWFGGRQVIAQCISDSAYVTHFPDANLL